MQKLTAVLLTLLISATQAHNFRCSDCGASAIEVKKKSEFSEFWQDLFGKKKSSLRSSVAQAGSELGTFVSSTAITFANRTKDAGTTFSDSVKNAATKTKEGIVNVPNNIKERITTSYTKTRDGFRNAATKTKEGIVNVPHSIKEGFVKTVDGVQYVMAKTGEWIAVSTERTGEAIKTGGQRLKENSLNFRPESYQTQHTVEAIDQEDTPKEESH